MRVARVVDGATDEVMIETFDVDEKRLAKPDVGVLSRRVKKEEIWRSRKCGEVMVVHCAG